MEYCPKERERERKQNKTKKQLHGDKEKDQCLKRALYQGAVCVSVSYIFFVEEKFKFKVKFQLKLSNLILMNQC